MNQLTNTILLKENLFLIDCPLQITLVFTTLFDLVATNLKLDLHFMVRNICISYVNGIP